MIDRRRVLLSAAGAALAATLAGCATMPHEVTVSREQLEAALARRFPHDERVGGLLVAKIGLPRLDLLAQDDRLRLEFPLEVESRIAHVAVHGGLAVSFGLRWEASDSSIRASGVQLERFDLRGVPPQWQQQLQEVGAFVAQNLLEGAVLHAFTREELARGGGWTPGEIHVTPRGVRMTLVPPGP